MTSTQLPARRRFDPNHLTARDVLILVPVIVGFSALQVVLAIMFGEQVLRWGGLLVNTAIAFGYFIHDSREERRRRVFWVLCIALLIVHLIGFGFVISRAQEWKPAWFMVIVPEMAIFLVLRNLFVRNS